MSTEVIMLLGGNLGDVRGRLAECREMLRVRVGDVVSQSKEYETEAWGFTSKELFVNQAIIVETELAPLELLAVTQSIERDLGRNRAHEVEKKMQSGERYASRVIDVDIITYGAQIFDSEELIIPHPRMHEREFVLLPMMDVAPEWCHPKLGATTEEMLQKLKSI